jgi:hypothetical protein
MIASQLLAVSSQPIVGDAEVADLFVRYRNKLIHIPSCSCCFLLAIYLLRSFAFDRLGGVDRNGAIYETEGRNLAKLCE